ncbi:MAG: hypothetical protein QNJ40_26850 [Xanthomonadales bacterium]|nr:hypothetical protein [Xanthomonadales bacterium]
MNQCNAEQLVAEALAHARDQNLAAAEASLKPIADTIPGAIMYGLVSMMAGPGPKDWTRAWSVLEAISEPAPDLDVVRATYEIFELHRQGCGEAGVTRLIQAESAGAVGAFEYLTYLVPALARSADAADVGIPRIALVSESLPHFAMALISAVHAATRKDRSGGLLGGLLSTLGNSEAAPLAQIPELAERITRVRQEFGQPCLLGLQLRLPKVVGEWVAAALRTLPTLKPDSSFGGGVAGISTTDDRDFGWIGFANNRVCAINGANSVDDIDDLPGQIDELFDAGRCGGLNLEFEEWEIESWGRFTRGYQIDGNLGRVLNLWVFNESYNNQGYVRIEQQAVLFAPELDDELSADAAKVAGRGRCAGDITLDDAGRDLAAERTGKRAAWLEDLASACSAAGEAKEEALVRAVDPSDAQQVENIGEKLFYAFAQRHKHIEAEADSWFEDEDFHKGFLEDLVGLSGNDITLSNLSARIEGDTEHLRCKLNSEPFEAKADLSLGSLDESLVYRLMRHCNGMGHGCYVTLLTSDVLAIAYVPRRIGQLLIEGSPVING